MTDASTATVKVTLKRSLIGRTREQIATAHGLGLRKIGDSVTIAPNPSQQGMLKKISHLVEVSA